MKKVFTLSYHQPLEYQFSLDSVELAKRVADQYRTHPHLSSLRFLDLCSGCGVIGLEIYYYLREIKKMDFVEVQKVYLEFFEKNLNLFDPRPDFRFINENYQTFGKQVKDQYDVIVCNPPYFFAGEGVLSPSDFKNRCRFYLDASFRELIENLTQLLVPGGEAFVLINKGEAYGKNRLLEAKSFLTSEFEFTILEKIRITDLVKIKRKNLY